MAHSTSAALRSLLGATILGGVASPALAAAQPTVPSAAIPNREVEEIIVTGSALRTTLDSVAVPVTVVSAKSIERAGVSNNVLDLIRKQIPSFAGRSNAGNSNANNTNQNTAGGSQAQLRNLDTLVLVNGRRVAPNAIAGIGGKVFVDLATIPSSAIERIEVLTDGASAIYGSDAVGGVINIILKSHFEGAEIDGRTGFAKGYGEQSLSFTVGHELTKGVQMTVSGSYNRSDPLYQKQRSFTSPFYSTSTAVPGGVGNNVLAPGLGSPSQTNPTGIFATAPSIAALVANGTYIATPTLVSPQTSPPTAQSNIPIVGTGVGGTYDLSQFQALLLQQEQKAIDANLTAHVLGDALVLFADGIYAETRSFTQFKPVTVGVTIPKNAPFNPINDVRGLGGVTFGSTADPKRFYNHDKSYRVTAGLRGRIGSNSGGWNWEVAYVRSQNELTQLQTNVIYGPNLARAIAGGYDANGNAVLGGAYSKVYSGFSLSGPLVLQPALDPLARATAINRASLANLFTTETIHAKSKLDSFDGKIAGTLFRLPGGGVDVAVGAAWRKESLSGTPDANGYVHSDPNYCNDGGNFVTNPSTYSGGQLADPFPVLCTTAAAGSRGPNSRKITSEFVEVRIPITGEGWHVPGLYALDITGALRHDHFSDAGNSTVPKIGFRWQPIDRQLTFRGTYSKSFTAPPLYQEYGPVNFRLAGPGIVPAAFPGLASGLTPVEDGVNPLLKPAKATSYSLGAVFHPDFIPRFHLDVEYSRVNEHGLPGGIGFSNIFLDVNQLGSASLFAGNIAKNAFPGSPGAIAFVNPGDLRAYLLANPANYNNVYAIDRFTNLGGLKARTLNILADYAIPTGGSGTFTVTTNAALFLSYKFQALPSQKYYEYAGTATNGGTGVQGILPKFRSYTTFDWTRGPLDVTIGNTYVSSIRDLGAGGITFETNSARTPPTAFEGRIKSYMSWDARIAYQFGKHEGSRSFLTLAAGVNNIFDRMPPVSTNNYTPSAAYTDNTADVSTYSPIGRIGYVTASVRF
ncbi:MAG: TonB-dependent receptor [Pseudomonadota bacterium]|nr:TonB-dependent receptor [Pseudomonadota bacterium]